MEKLGRRLGLSEAYLLAGAAAIGAYFLIPNGSVTQVVAYSAIAATSVVALVAGARLRLPEGRRLPWYLFAAGTLAFTIGDSIFDAYTVGDAAIPFPSAADWIYLAAYPFLFAGMVLVLLPFGRQEGPFVLIEAAIVTTAFVLVQWVFVLAPAAELYEGTLERAISVAYPAMDILLVATVAPLLLSRAARTPAFVLLVAAVLTLLVADEVYYSRNVLYRWLDVFWLASYVCWGAAALHPSVATLAAGRREREPRLSILRILLLGAALAATPIVLIVEEVRGKPLRPYLIAAFGLVIGGLVLLRLVALVRRITAQNVQLRELDRLKDDFIGMVSHDLRTPLVSIGGYVELLQEDEKQPLNAEQRSFLDVVARNTDRMLHQVDDLLFVAALQAGRIRLELGDVDLGSVAQRAVEEAQPRAVRKGLELTCLHDGPTMVRGDEAKLAQLLDNLVSNAVKFTPEGGTVSVRVAGEDGAVVLEVADSGVGIPEEERGQLFDRFFRSPSATAGHVPGTGLGLYIAKAIADAHDGVIEVESAEGRGTTFRVTLPSLA